MKFERIVIATRNPSKKERYRYLFSGYADEILDLDDFGLTEKPTETGESAEQNAEIKASFYAQKIGLVAFSEDEALFVDFLPDNEQPGVHVRRINGRDEVEDDKILEHWERILSKIPRENRTGRWHIAYCLATPDGKVKTVSLNHPITFFSPSSKVRLPGWPMSSLEGPKAFGKPHSELNDEERQLHNARTNKLVVEKLKELFIS